MTGTTEAVTPWAIKQGTLSISSDTNLGAASGSLSFDGGTLQTTAAFTTARGITLNAGGGTLNTGADLTASGVISGPGALTKTGNGTLTLNANNPYGGPTTVQAGTLVVGDPGHSSAALSGGGPVTIANGATLGGFGSVAGDVNNFGTIAVGNALSAFSGAQMVDFTIGGNYTAHSTLILSTVLNAGGPLSNQFTDRLLIRGNAGGSTTVQLKTSRGGAFTNIGAPTASSGFSLIQVAGNTSPGAFTLPGGFITGGTPFQYRLNAYGPGSTNGLADPGQNLVGNAGGYWDFRLQSIYVTRSGELQPVRPRRPTRGRRSRRRSHRTLRRRRRCSTPACRISAPCTSVWARSATRRPRAYRSRARHSCAPTAAPTTYTSSRSFNDYGFDASQGYAALQLGASAVALDDESGTLRLGLAGSYGKLQFNPNAPEGWSEGNFSSGKLSGIATYQARIAAGIRRHHHRRLVQRHHRHDGARPGGVAQRLEPRRLAGRRLPDRARLAEAHGGAATAGLVAAPDVRQRQ